MRYKCPVLTALNGQKGLDLLTHNPDINLLIVDMHMPNMNGLTFIKRVKEQETFNNIPIIAVYLEGTGRNVAGSPPTCRGSFDKTVHINRNTCGS